MCKHDFVRLNDVSVCVKCGFTVTRDRHVVFDRRLRALLEKKREKSKKRGKNG